MGGINPRQGGSCPVLYVPKGGTKGTFEGAEATGLTALTPAAAPPLRNWDLVSIHRLSLPPKRSQRRTYWVPHVGGQLISLLSLSSQSTTHSRSNPETAETSSWQFLERLLIISTASV
ncbi:hypothetical protein G7054_g8023 [Neopestalotiopsis clavispora]|nr:hypothetical protein G7054_g8023 [Neopestalotiopsis clavispora]